MEININDYRPKIAKRMANGDDHTAAWLLRAEFHKIKTGPNAGTWIAFKPGMFAYITADHPANLGCCWYDWDGLKALQDALDLAQREPF